MDVNSAGYSLYALDTGDRENALRFRKETLRQRENEVDHTLDLSSRNPIFWHRNKLEIEKDVESLKNKGSTRHGEFKRRMESIGQTMRDRSSTKLNDMTEDNLSLIMKELSPEQFASLMMTKNKRIYNAGSSKMKKTCDEFLKKNSQSPEDFCLSKEPINQMCRYRTNKCKTVYSRYQQEVVPVPGQPEGAYRIIDGVTEIAYMMFSGHRGETSDLVSISIPDSVKIIGTRAFEHCENLTSVTIGKSVTWIGYRAFEECENLTSVTIPKSVTEIEDSTFSGCRSLTSVTIPNSVTKIESKAFSGCIRLTSVTIPDSVTKIGYEAFSFCENLTSVTIPDSVTEIGNRAFQYCMSLTTVTIGNSVTKINNYAFSGCRSLTSVTIGNSVTEIGWNAFENCKSLTSVTIPDSVIIIDWNAFEDCDSLTTVTIPDSTRMYSAFPSHTTIIGRN